MIEVGVSAMLVACNGGTSDTQGFTVVNSAGVRIVESVTPAWDEGTARIDPEPLVQIGREEVGPYQFALVTDGTLLRNGNIAVAEFSAQEVRIFDESGQHMLTFGRAGEGPGEFRGLCCVFEYRGDSIAAFDGRLFRTTIISVTSGAHRTIPNQVQGNYSVFGILGDGSFLLFSLGGSFRPDLSPGLQWVPTDVVGMDPDGSSRVIAQLPAMLRMVAADGNAPMPVPQQYAVQGAATDGFYWATSDRFEIGFHDIDGRVQQIMRRPVAPQPVESSMIEQYIEARLDWVRRFEGEEAVPRYRASLEADQYSEHLPFYSRAFVDSENRLWLGSSEWPVDDASRVWSIFAREGHWLGELEASEGLEILDASTDRVLAIWRDSLDVPHVQTHRLLVTDRLDR